MIALILILENNTKNVLFPKQHIFLHFIIIFIYQYMTIDIFSYANANCPGHTLGIFFFGFFFF